MVAAAARRARILESIAAAARMARRNAADIELIAVSKTRSAAEIGWLIAAGQRAFGESRVQEAAAKWPALRAAHGDIRLHCIGRLQSNKADAAVRLFDVIHSLDRLSLLDSLVAAAVKAKRSPGVYVQVKIGEEGQKGGCSLAELAGLIAAVRGSPLRLDGLMAIPPLGPDPAPSFALLAEIARRHDVSGLSIGMSSDFPTAVMLGASAVRVGTSLFEG